MMRCAGAIITALAFLTGCQNEAESRKSDQPQKVGDVEHSGRLQPDAGGTEPRFKVANVEDPRTEAERLERVIPADQGVRLRTAAIGLGLLATMEATSEEEAKYLIVSRLNGKTPAQVIAEYEKLSPELKIQVAELIRKAAPTTSEAEEGFKKAIALLEQEHAKAGPMTASCEAMQAALGKKPAHRVDGGHHVVEKYTWTRGFQTSFVCVIYRKNQGGKLVLDHVCSPNDEPEPDQLPSGPIIPKELTEEEKAAMKSGQ